MRVPARTGEKIKCTGNSAMRDHKLISDNILFCEYISVLANRTNDFSMKLQEKILIHCDGPQLNKVSESNTFKCYDQWIHVSMALVQYY